MAPLTLPAAAQIRPLTAGDLGMLCACAVRYALPRQTYISSWVTRVVRGQWPSLPLSERRTIHREVAVAIAENRAGDLRIDTPDWLELLEFMNTQTEQP